jgi:hypothetical protein
MKYTVIKIINDGVIAVNKNNIACFDESSLLDDTDYRIDIYIGQVLTSKTTDRADRYWHYTKKEWSYMNSRFSNFK